jgi:uncharacterized membrane protein
VYDWLLFLHVLAAFALVAGVVSYGVVVLAPAGDAARRVLAAPAMALWNAGGIGTLVLGVWLALDVDGYELWDGWILAAIVLWFVASAAGGPLSRGVRDSAATPDRRREQLLFAVVAAASAVILVLMIVKPGA